MTDKELRDVGLKVTLPRLKILKILEKADPRHMSADEVYRKLIEEGEDVGMATVYRVLTQFESAGLIKRLNFENYSVFELDQGDHHDHLVCLGCGQVTEFVDQMIEQQQVRIAKQHGFTIANHNHIIYGFCSNCKKKKKNIVSDSNA